MNTSGRGLHSILRSARKADEKPSIKVSQTSNLASLTKLNLSVNICDSHETLSGSAIGRSRGSTWNDDKTILCPMRRGFSEHTLTNRTARTLPLDHLASRQSKCIPCVVRCTVAYRSQPPALSSKIEGPKAYVREFFDTFAKHGRQLSVEPVRKGQSRKSSLQQEISRGVRREP